MTRSHRIISLFSALIVGVGAAGTTHANITLSISYVTLGGNANANTLNSNGWIGVKIFAVADAAAGQVSGFDLDSNGWGIYGNIHQAFRLTDPSSTGTWTNVDMTPQGTTPTGLTSPQVDSFFDNFPGQSFSAIRALREDSDRANGPNPPYDQSPLTDTGVLHQGPGDPDGLGLFALDYGVGTSLHGAGSFFVTGAWFAVQPVAYLVIHPDYVTYPNVGFRLVGVFTDTTPLVNVSFVDTAAPEPASLSALALGSLLLLARRRR